MTGYPSRMPAQVAVARGTRRLTRSRPFTAAQAAERLHQLAYLERACAHILAGWIVRTPLLDVKIAWGQHLAANMEHASRLRERARALQPGDDQNRIVPVSWRDRLRAIDEPQQLCSCVRGYNRYMQTARRVVRRRRAAKDNRFHSQRRNGDREK